MVINPIVTDERGRSNDIFSKNLENRVIHLVGEVTDEMSASITAQLLHLAAVSDEDIQLYINSPGGSVSAGLAIYDTMQYIKPDVATVCLGRAASMGAVILSGGAKGKRAILPHGEVMIHQVRGGSQGVMADMKIEVEHAEKIQNTLYNILAANTGKSFEQIAKDADRDNWFSAQEAVDYGLVDKIITKK